LLRQELHDQNPKEWFPSKFKLVTEHTP
jgi:hypothetical protein